MRNNYQDIAALAKALTALREMEGEFTRKEYEAKRIRHSTSIDRLVRLGILRKTRKEVFPLEVRVPYYYQGQVTVILTTDDGTVIIDLNPVDYQRFPVPVRKAIDIAYNNGKPLTVNKVKRGETETIMAERFFYRFDEDAFKTAMVKEKKHLASVLDRKQKAMEKAIKAFDNCKMLYESLA